MIVNMDKCVGCGRCVPYCPASAISVVERKAFIDLDKCFECGSCKQSGVCLKNAFVQQTMSWPRYVRAIFSNVSVPSPNTGVPGRGTEEMKTNELTDRYPDGKVGIACEMGRPGVGTTMRDVERIAKTVVANGGVLEKENPTSFIFDDITKGTVKPDYLSERAMSVIVEATIDREQLVPMLSALKDAAKGVSTVFSVDCITKMENGRIPTEPLVRQAGCTQRPNGKTNVGLGHI